MARELVDGSCAVQMIHERLSSHQTPSFMTSFGRYKHSLHGGATCFPRFMTVCCWWLFVFFLFILFFSSSFAPTLVKFQNNPFNCSPLTFGHYTFNYYFFIFWISYKIIDAFQFYPLIVFLFINYLSNYKYF